MARMIPSVIDPETESPAERRLYSVFAENLPGRVTVFHSVPWLRKRKEGVLPGEADFVIVSPEHGLLFLECKGGRIECDGSTGSWWSTDRYRTRHELRRSPAKQVQDSQRRIRKAIEQAGIPGAETITKSYAVIFPDMRSGVIPGLLDLPREIQLTREDLDDIESAVERVYRFWGQTRKAEFLTPKQFNSIIAAISPTFALALFLSLDCERQHLEALTERQYEILETLASVRRALITGCAGRGKTLLAVEKARRLSREGFRVLYVCFNLFLADHVRRIVSDCLEDVEVHSFESLCRKAAERAGMPWNRPSDHRDIPRFFDVAAPELLLEAAERLGPMYDAVVVDEGQDFLTDYFAPIEELLHGGSRGVLYVFADPKQDVFGRAPKYPEGLETPFLLSRNCRNTLTIARFLQELSEDSAVRTTTRAPVGESPRLVPGESPEELRTAVLRILDDLCSSGGLSPQRVVVLSCCSAERSLLNSVDRLGSHKFCHNQFPPPDDRVLVTSILKYKGLEADAVIITDLDPGSRAFSRKLLYVGASRARHRLYLVGTPDAISRLRVGR